LSSVKTRPCFLVLPQFRFSRTLNSTFHAREETQLSQLATKAGIDAEQLVKNTILRLIKDEISLLRPAAPDLRVWDLGAIGPLHRFDLQLTASMLANVVSRIYTYTKGGFEVFKELAVSEP